jgi:hypothetical protein
LWLNTVSVDARTYKYLEMEDVVCICTVLEFKRLGPLTSQKHPSTVIHYVISVNNGVNNLAGMKPSPVDAKAPFCVAETLARSGTSVSLSGSHSLR